MTHRTAFIAGLLSLSAAVPAAGDRLLDQDREPVADAWVVATRRECIGPGHCSTYCVEVIVAKTDRSGEYDFASGLLTRDAYGVTAYREGYVARHRQAG
jgi:hypothetical protein